MILQGQPNAGQAGRTFYPLDAFAVTVTHFVVRQTTPDNPFTPHAHAQPEMWYIMAGEGVLCADGHETPVTAGDLIAIEPWREHGLRTETQVGWICMG